MSETQSSTAESSATRYTCTYPGCKRSFARKEHCTRHARSHDARLKYRCHICGSKYARSDVLRRHIQNHPTKENTKTALAACVACRESKLKCDDATPCTTCVSNSIACSRETLTTPGESADTTSQTDAQMPNNDLEINEHVQDQTTSSSFPTQSQDINELHRLTSLRDISMDMRKLVVIYFTDVHPVWPILHQATFEQSMSTRILLMAVGALGSYFEGSEHHTKLAAILFTNALTSLTQEKIRLQDLQACLLCIIYYLYFASSKQMLDKAGLLHAALVSVCRSKGIFSGKFQEKRCTHDPRSEWTLQEERKRLALYLLRIDAYHSMISFQPPMIQYPEIEVSLPKSESLWSAITNVERQRFEWEEPAAREKTVFKDVAYDAWVMQTDLSKLYRLTSEDHHLILCSMQSILWNTAHTPNNSRSNKPFEQFGRAPRLAICLTQLDAWTRNVEEQCQLQARYFASTSEETCPISAPMSLYLLHLAGFKLHYPSPVAFKPDNPFGSKLSPHGGHHLDSVSARTATWHAIQLTRIFVHETALPQSSFFKPRSYLNPLHLPSICRAAVVVCDYLRYSKDCPSCTAQSYNSSVELMTAKPSNESLVQWKEGNSVHASIDLGFTEVPFCQCSFGIISTWYQNHLRIDDDASAAFLAFLEILQEPSETR